MTLLRFLLASICIVCFTHVMPAQTGTPDVQRYSRMVAEGEEYYLSKPDTALRIWLQVDSSIAAIVSGSARGEFKELKTVQASAKNNIAFIYTDKGLMNAALDYNFGSSRLREEVGDSGGIAESYNNIAFLYLREKDTAHALEYFQKSEAGYVAINDVGGIAYTRVNQGQIFAARKQHAEALDLYRQAISFLTGLEKEQRGLASCINSIGLIYSEQGQFDSALYYVRNALTIRRKIDDEKGIAGSYGSLARIYHQAAIADSALYYGRKGYEAAKPLHIPDLITVNAKLLSEIYIARGDFEEGYKYYSIAIATRDSISDRRVLNELLEHELNYSYGKKFAADSTKNVLAQQLLDTELKQSTNQRYILIGVLALVLFFTLVVFNRFRVTRKQKFVIELQKRVVEAKQKEVLDSIHYATRIQQALLAGTSFLDQSLRDYFVLYAPKDIVSGDFYWATKTGSKFWLCAADCTGHGVPGAFMSLLNISFLNEAVNERKLGDPGSVLNYVRTKVIDALAADGSAEGGKDGMDCILCCFDFGQSVLTFASANNALWLMRDADGAPQLTEFSTDKMPVGLHVNEHLPFAVQSVQLQKGDVIYLFTDGYPDQFGGPKARKFLYRRLRELLGEISSMPMPAQKEKLMTSFTDWRSGREQIDDVLVIGVRV